MKLSELLHREAPRYVGCFCLSTKTKCPDRPGVREALGERGAPRQRSGLFFLEDGMSKRVLSFEDEGRVGPDLLILRALGDAIAAIGVAGPMAALLDGTLINLGYLIVDKVETVGVVLGVMED
jgi:hypothetical protein